MWCTSKQHASIFDTYAPIINPQPLGTHALVGTHYSAGDLCMLTSLPAGNMYRVAAMAWWWSFGPGIWAGTWSRCPVLRGLGLCRWLSIKDALLLRGSRWILAGDLSASKEWVWPWFLIVPGYLGAGDANDRCIIKTRDQSKLTMNLCTYTHNTPKL